MYVFGHIAQAKQPSLPMGAKKQFRRTCVFCPRKKVELDVFRVPKNIHQYVFVRTENILMYVFLVGIRADVSRFGVRRYLCVRVLPGSILPVLPSPIPVMKLPPRHITVSDRI